MIKVKVLCKGTPPDQNINQYSGNNDNLVNGVKFVFDPDDDSQFDFIFIIDNLDDKNLIHKVKEGGLFFFTAEHIYEEDFYIKNDNVKKFINQFSRIFSSYLTNHINHNYEIPFLPWMINHNHGTHSPSHQRDIGYFKKLDFAKKTKFLSVICSTKVFSPQQRVRLEFVSKLKSILGEDLDWFGNGVNPIDDKWSAISKYKYHLVLENRIGNNVVSEKLFDSYLGLSFPLYSGAPNIYDFFSTNSLVQIDTNNIEGTLLILDKLKKEGVYEKSHEELINSKDKVLADYNMWFRLANIAKTYFDTLGNVRQHKLVPLKSRSALQIFIDMSKNLIN
jgi:hypothetical protein